MIRTGNQSHYFSVAAIDDPALLNVHQVVEVEFASTNDVQRERYDLGFEDNHLSQLLDDESALALEGLFPFRGGVPARGNQAFRSQGFGNTRDPRHAGPRAASFPPT